jgi:hypothetical protein
MFVTGEIRSTRSSRRWRATSRCCPPPAPTTTRIAYGLLGEVIARLSGLPYTDYVEERILAPLGLTRTAWAEQEPSAIGYLVHEYAGTAAREPHTEMGGVASMGQLWSTVGDLCRWAAFLVEGHDDVLSAATLDEMWSPQSMMNPDDWTVGWGLGLELVNHEGRVFGGHGGSMPGFLAGLYVNRQTSTGASVLTNSGTRAPTRDIPLDLAGATIGIWPPDGKHRRPESPPPPEVGDPRPLVVGGLRARLLVGGREAHGADGGAPKRIKPTVFEPLPGGGFRAVEGRERGERLRIEGDRMVWGGYPFSRRQERTTG